MMHSGASVQIVYDAKELDSEAVIQLGASNHFGSF